VICRRQRRLKPMGARRRLLSRPGRSGPTIARTRSRLRNGSAHRGNGCSGSPRERRRPEPGLAASRPGQATRGSSDLDPGPPRGLGAALFDVALMTSHVAQVFITDEEWAGVLSDLRQALVSRRRLAFDTRDPWNRGWERWSRAESYGHVTPPDGQVVESWTELRAAVDDVVTFSWHNIFPDRSELHGVSSPAFDPRSWYAKRSRTRTSESSASLEVGVVSRLERARAKSWSSRRATARWV
jgi:hypothetical protein